MSPAEIREKIKAAMLDAFRQPNDLKQLFQYQLGDNLQNYVGNIGLDDMISEIINKFDSQSRLDELIIAAIMANPTNKYLKDLANEINDILPFPNKDLLYQNFSKERFSVLNDIEIDTFKNACFKAIISEKPEAYIHKLSKVELLLKKLQEEKYTEVKNKISFFILEKLVFQEYPGINGNQKIEKIKEILRDDKNSKYDEIYSYLLIIINDKYEISAYLIYDHKFPDNIDAVNIELKRLERNRKTTFFNQFKQEVNLFVNNALAMLVQNGIKSPILTIEFFLPCDYLGEKVDQYKFRHESSKRDFTIGDEHPVVVRSYDRLKDARWNIKIQHGMKRLHQKRDSEIQEVFEHLHELDNITSKELTRKLEERIGLKLKCCLPVDKKKRKQLFEAILDSGLPIAIWIRNSTIYNRDEIDEILSEVSLKNLISFSQSVFKKRKAAFSAGIPEQCLGYHLALLCEYPELNKEFTRIINHIQNYLYKE